MQWSLRTSCRIPEGPWLWGREPRVIYEGSSSCGARQTIPMGRLRASGGTEGVQRTPGILWHTSLLRHLLEGATGTRYARRTVAGPPPRGGARQSVEGTLALRRARQRGPARIACTCRALQKVPQKACMPQNPRGPLDPLGAP